MSDADAAQLTGDSPLAVICGGGTLPFAVADAVGKRGRRVVLFAIRGWADPERVAAYPHHWASFGQFGWFCRVAQREGCRDVVLIGSVVRPAIWQIRPDFKTLRLLPRIFGLLRGGDDRLLKGVAAIFEEHGFRLVGAHEIAPDILMPEGPLGRERPECARPCRHRDGARFAQRDQPVRRRPGRSGRRRPRAGDRGGGRYRPHACAHRRASPKRANSCGHGTRRTGQGGKARAGSAGRLAFDRAANGRRRGAGRACRHRRRCGQHDHRRTRGYRCSRRPRAIVRDRCARRDGYVMTASAQPGRPAETVDVFLVAGEESGDRLGAALMRALRERTAGKCALPASAAARWRPKE